MQDSMVVIEQSKSGFERPGDLEFEDYSQGINRASSDSSLGTPKGPMDLLGKNRSKNFWLFSKRSKVGHSTPAEHIRLIWPNNTTSHWKKKSMNTLTPPPWSSAAGRKISRWAAFGSLCRNVSVWAVEPAVRARKSPLQRALMMDLWLTLHTHTLTHVYTPFPSMLAHEPRLFNYTWTHTPPNTSRTGPLHESIPGCEWTNLAVPPPLPPSSCPHHLPLSAAWFPIGQLAVSILLCLCFHQHGAQTTLNFPLQASTNTLLPLYWPEHSIMSPITIKSLYQQSGWHQVCQVRKIGSRPTSYSCFGC